MTSGAGWRRPWSSGPRAEGAIRQDRRPQGSAPARENLCDFVTEGSDNPRPGFQQGEGTNRPHLKKCGLNHPIEIQ